MDPVTHYLILDNNLTFLDNTSPYFSFAYFNHPRFSLGDCVILVLSPFEAKAIGKKQFMGFVTGIDDFPDMPGAYGYTCKELPKCKK